MNILFIGDVFGKGGRNILSQKLPQLIKKLKIDIVIANIENIAHGKGVRQKDVDLLKSLGVNVFTGGNHSFDNKEILKVFEKEEYILRPANYPVQVPGKGHCIFNDILVINLMGRVFMPEGMDSPFQKVDEILDHYKDTSLKGIIIDFHAETTSEKQAMFYYVNKRVSGIFGTHTHVQTADERISSEGTAYISDVGMTGVYDSVIGMKKEEVIEKFLTGVPVRFEPAEGKSILSAVYIQIDSSGKSQKIQRVSLHE